MSRRLHSTWIIVWTQRWQQMRSSIVNTDSKYRGHWNIKLLVLLCASMRKDGLLLLKYNMKCAKKKNLQWFVNCLGRYRRNVLYEHKARRDGFLQLQGHVSILLE